MKVRLSKCGDFSPDRTIDNVEAIQRCANPDYFTITVKKNDEFVSIKYAFKDYQALVFNI